jgi:hypothetical protein
MTGKARLFSLMAATPTGAEMLAQAKQPEPPAQRAKILMSYPLSYGSKYSLRPTDTAPDALDWI